LALQKAEYPQQSEPISRGPSASARRRDGAGGPSAAALLCKYRWVAVERQRLETELKLEREERRRERDAFHKCLKMLRQRCDIGEPREG